MKTRQHHGFTLIELVIVMIVISVGLLGLTSLFSNSATTLSTNETLQQATQYAQKCAESAMAKRRASTTGIAALNGFACDSLPATFTYSDAAHPTVVGSSYTGAPCPTNPAGLSCRNIDINVTSAANSDLYASITLMLVSY